MAEVVSSGAPATKPDWGDPAARDALMAQIAALDDEADDAEARLRAYLDPRTHGPEAEARVTELAEALVAEVRTVETLATEDAAAEAADAAQVEDLEQLVEARRRELAALGGG